MNDVNATVTLKRSKLQETYRESCPEVKLVLGRLYGDDVEPEKTFCCNNFEKYYNGCRTHPKFIFDSEHGDYYVFPDISGWQVWHCPTCGAKYDGKEWSK